MKFLTKTLLALTLLLSFQNITAQVTATEKTELKRNEGNIGDQFEYVITKSYTYRGNGKRYKNVEFHWLTELKKSVQDSLKAVHKNLADTEVVVNTQAKEIKELKTNLGSTNATLSATNEEKDNMSLFGLQMSKASYNVLMWSIIGGLFALLLVFIYRFNRSNSSTKEAKLKLDEIETEFEDHRRTALEREQKVRRQLQDEINKQKA